MSERTGARRTSGARGRSRVAQKAGREVKPVHIRLARDDLGWVEKLARDVGVSPHFLMRETIVRHVRDVAAVLLAEAPPPRPVELAPWLAGRTGIAASLMRRAIATGRVSVAGEVCTEPRAIVEQGVTLDGESV